MTGDPLTLHFTRLAHDGKGKACVTPAKILLRGHRKAGGVIRLWRDDSVTHGLAIAEGIETALTIAHVYTPVWSTIDGGNLARFPVLPGIECLTIYADHDRHGAGIKYAEQCAARWARAGRDVWISEPKQAGDWNNVVTAA